MKKFIAFILSFCFLFTFSLTANATETSFMITEIVDSLSGSGIQNLVKYNTVTKTETAISYNDLKKYSNEASISYEIEDINRATIPAMAKAIDTPMPLGIIDQYQQFTITPPILYSESQHPYSGVVCIVSERLDRETNQITEVVTTGFIVSSNIVVTAAHCVLPNADSNYNIENIRIYPKYHTSVAPVNNSTANYVSTTELIFDATFVQSNKSSTAAKQSDWCILVLESDLFSVHHFAYTYTPLTSGTTVYISGYPHCLITEGFHNNCNHELYPNGLLVTSSGAYYGMNNGMLCHFANTYGGNSGSPVYTSSYICHAIHSYDKTKIYSTNGSFVECNQATSITEAIFNVIANAIVENL